MMLYCAWSSFLQNWDRRIINKMYYYYSLNTKQRKRRADDGYKKNRPSEASATD